MKTKIKRHSRSVISVILAVCMLVSCMTAGMIATDAAKVSNEENAAVGAALDDDSSNNGEAVGAEVDSESVGAYNSFRIIGDFDGKTGQWGTNGKALDWYSDNENGKKAWKVNVRLTKNTNFHILAYYSQNNSQQNKEITTNADADRNTTDQLNPGSGNMKWVDETCTVDIHINQDGWIWFSNFKEYSTSVKIIGELSDAGSDWNTGYSMTQDDSNTNNYYFTVSKTTIQQLFRFKIGTDEYGCYGSHHKNYDLKEQKNFSGSKYGMATGADMKDGNETHCFVFTPSDHNYKIWVDSEAHNVWLEQLPDPVATGLSLQIKTGESAYGTSLAMNEENQSAELKITATGLATDNVSYKLYSSDGALINTRFVTDRTSTFTFNVTPTQSSITYYATIEATDGSDLESVTSNTVVITNSAYSDPQYYLVGRIIDGQNTNWDKTAGALAVDTRVSGHVFSYFYDPSLHGGSSADPDFRILSSDGAYTGDGDPYKLTSEKYTSSPYEEDNKYFTLPDNYNCYTIFIDQSGTTPIIWCEKSNSKSIKVVAKDCSIRERGSGTGPHYTLCTAGGETYANTVLTGVDVDLTTTPLKAYIRNANTDVKDDCGEVATVYTGKTIRVTTTIRNEDFKKDYYVAGFCFNGETYELLTPNNSGVYTTTYTIPDDISENYLEITPIFFLKDSSKAITFYVEGFDDSVKQSWGNTIAVYPYYANKTANENAFGGYPGQPMIFYGGRYYSQIPTTHNGSTVQGITLSNYYWDDVHSNRSNGTTVHLGEVTDHRQTYDYDDFYRIFTNKEPTTIVFSFKYETTMDNGNPTPSTTTAINTANFTNGWEDLTDYYGRKVDLFGNIIGTSNGTIYVVSDGYDQNYIGHYATEWYVYDTDGAYITKIPSSALLMNSSTDVTNEPDNRKAEEMNNDNKFVTPMSSYASAYSALENYTGYEVKITYEKEILNNSTYRGTKSLGYGEEATRCDGRWYYSKAGDTISADIKIEYNDTYYDANGDQTTFTEDTPYVTGANDNVNQGTKTGCRAYFTNTAANQENKVYTYLMESGTVVHDETKNFTFTADTNGSDYILLGWYLVREGKYTQITKMNIVNGESSMSSNATFVARFVKAPTGKLRVKHTIDNNSPYTGSGSPFVSVYVFDSQEKAEAYIAGDTTKVPKFIKEDSTTQVEVPQASLQTGSDYVYIQLKTAPAGNTHSFYEFLGGDSTKADTYIASRKINNSKVSETITSNVPQNYITSVGFNVSEVTEGSDNQRTLLINSLSYQSRLKRITYAITYNYDSYRHIYNSESSNLRYVASDAFTEAEFDSYLTFAEVTVKDESNNDKTLHGVQFQTEKSDDFFAKKAPFVDNFMTTMTWNFSNPQVHGYQQDNRQITATIMSQTNSTNEVNVEFRCPYEYAATDHGVTFTKDTNGRIVKLSNNATKNTDNITAPYLGWYCLNKNVSGYKNNPIFFSAPATIYDNGTALSFKYWSVKNMPNVSDKNVNSEEYTRCYSRDFNFTLYKDSIVEPIYAASESAEHQTKPSIIYLETSRNQWNHGGNPVRTTETQGDRLFIDFLLTFDRADKLQLNTVASADRGNSDTGLLLDRIALIDGDTKSAADYAKDYDESDGKAAAETFLRSTFGNGTTTNAADGQAQEYRKSATAVNKLDNKNRIEKYFGFPNIDPASGKSTGRKNYVYRAYAYMMEKNPETDVITVSLSAPIYFTFYDMASIEDCTDQLLP